MISSLIHLIKHSSTKSWSICPTIWNGIEGIIDDQLSMASSIDIALHRDDYEKFNKALSLFILQQMQGHDVVSQKTFSQLLNPYLAIWKYGRLWTARQIADIDAQGKLQRFMRVCFDQWTPNLLQGASSFCPLCMALQLTGTTVLLKSHAPLLRVPERT